MIICITAWFDKKTSNGSKIPDYENPRECPLSDEKELLISYGFDPETEEIIPMPNISPNEAGAEFDPEIGEFVIR